MKMCVNMQNSAEQVFTLSFNCILSSVLNRLIKNHKQSKKRCVFFRKSSHLTASVILGQALCVIKMRTRMVDWHVCK